MNVSRGRAERRHPDEPNFSHQPVHKIYVVYCHLHEEEGEERD